MTRESNEVFEEEPKTSAHDIASELASGIRSESGSRHSMCAFPPYDTHITSNKNNIESLGLF